MSQAQKLAQDKRLDLVEVAPQAQPPVVKIVELKKFLYEEDKKLQKEKRLAKKGSELKQITLKPFINENDLGYRLEKAGQFLVAGNKVRFIIRFFGRTMAHKEFGYELMGRITKNLTEMAEVDHEPRFHGNQLEMTFNPKKGKNGKKRT